MNARSSRMHIVMRSCVAAATLTLAACGSDDHVLSDFACHAGAWQDANGQTFVLSPTTNGAMRYRLVDGRSGLLRPKVAGEQVTAFEGWREDGPVVARATFGECSTGTLDFSLLDGPQGQFRRVPLVSEDIRFSSGDVSLRGRMLLPAQTQDPVPLAVLVHGSESYSAVDGNSMQYLLPVQGVAVFVYDKRGTGGSEGAYTQDFDVLAADAVAAMTTARELKPSGFSRAGYVGASQGGWVAPLAASRSAVDYTVVLYGLAESALAEDREQVANDLRAEGYGEDVLAKAREVSDATATLMASGFSEGFDALHAVKRKYGDEPWFEHIQGEYTGRVLAFPAWIPEGIARRIAMHYDQGTSWNHEPLPLLESLPIPQLWVIAADDMEAPNAETLRRIRALQSSAHPIDLAVFPHTDHGMFEFEQDNDGDRIPLRHADGYFALVADWIAQRTASNTYGDAVIEWHEAEVDPAPPTAPATAPTRAP